MKRLLTLLAASLLAFTANSQNLLQRLAQPGRTRATAWAPGSPSQSKTMTPAQPLVHAKVSTITPFFTDTFNSTSLTTGGWVAGGNTPSFGTWKFTRQASTGPYGLDKINSTSSAGGWMLYDSDSIGFLFNSSPQVGTLTSPTISCLSHQYVGVRFQQYTRRFQDTFLLQVSNNGGSSWTSYTISPNMGLGTNDFTENPELTTINVTPTAGLQANVKVRFYYSGTFVGGGYNWMVDDFQMVDLDPIDLAVGNSGVIMTLGGGSGFTPVGTRPMIFVDSVYPLSEVTNIGGQAVSSVNVNANIYISGGSVYNKLYPFTNIPINAFDSLANFTTRPGYLPVSTGDYFVAFSNHAAGDLNTANDVDTALFSVSDSSLCTFSGYREASKTLNGYFYRGGYYLHAPATTGRPNGTSFYMGTFFDIPSSSAKDTITSVSICLAPNTAPGSQIQVEVYKFDSNTPVFNSVGATFVKTLTAADISTTSGLVFTSLLMNIGTAKNFTIASTGTYVAVARPVNPAAAQTMVVAAARVGAPANVVGSFGISDSSNGLAFNFGNNIAGNTNLTVFDDVPALVVNFGDARKLLLGINEISGLHTGAAFPNPANTILNIPVSATSLTVVSICLYNMMGQKLRAQDLGLIAAGQSRTAVFSTRDLPPGVYMYTLEANGQRMTNRVVVAH